MLNVLLSSKAQNSVSIYEYGDSINDCETNFKNLYGNWNSDNVTNASEYKFTGCSYVETLEDSARYRYYRNYFSGEKVVSGSYSSSKNTSLSMVNGKLVEETNRETFLTPALIYPQFYDQRRLTDSMKQIYSDDFIIKARRILESDLNIDTLKLKYYTYFFSKIDTTIEHIAGFTTYGISEEGSDLKVAYVDTISQNYIDNGILNKNTYDQLPIEELRKLILEELLLDKIGIQERFNKQVGLGDKVYLVEFMYNHQEYSNYVICNSQSHKVVWDTFFKSIEVYPPVDEFH